MPCRHQDVRSFDGVRCCLECGEALFDAPPSPGDPSDADETGQYKYRSLNTTLGQEIRLITVFPGRYDEDVFCDINHVDLSDDPQYELLSCDPATAKGEIGLSGRIFCHGKTIAVTKSCEMAFKRLRRASGKRILWMDAVCIDHSNLSERNSQVGLRKKIISSAVQTVVYLGESDELSDMAIGYLRTDVQLPAFDTPGVLDPFFSTRTWFSRVWSLQEMALSKMVTMLVGNQIVYLDKTVMDRILQPPAPLRWLKGSKAKKDILDALQDARLCHASDPRDQVFATLGLQDDDESSLVSVDYAKPANALFIELAVQIINHRKAVDILSYVTETSQGVDVPSWVPDWSFSPTTSQYIGKRLQLSDEESELISRWTFDFSHSTVLSKRPPMPLSGSTISAYNLSPWFDSSNESTPDVLTDPFGSTMRRKAFASFQHFSTLGSSPNIRLRARGHRLDSIKLEIPKRDYICGGLYSEWPPALGSTKPCRCREGTELELNGVVSTTGVTNYFFAYIDSEVRLFDARRYGNLMEVRTEQSIAYVPLGAEHGDSIWAIDGAKRLVLLREAACQYVFLGECFLYGALRQFHPCINCGQGLQLWPVTTEWIEIL